MSPLNPSCFPQVLKEEKLAENAERMGALLRAELSKITNERLGAVRGRGLLSAIDIKVRHARTLRDDTGIIRGRNHFSRDSSHDVSSANI